MPFPMSLFSVSGQNGFHNCPINDDLTPGRYLSTPFRPHTPPRLSSARPAQTHSVGSTPKPSATASGYRLPPENKEPSGSHPPRSRSPPGRLFQALGVSMSSPL